MKDEQLKELHKRTETLMNVLALGEEFVFQLEQLKGMSKYFNPKLDYHADKTVIQFEKATDKLFKEIEDVDAVMGLYNMNRELFTEIAKLNIAEKNNLLLKLQENKAL